MAGGTGNLKLIIMSDDEEEDESTSQGQGQKSGAKASKEQHVYHGIDATILANFCQSSLRKLSEKCHCLISRDPSFGQAEKIAIKEAKESYSKDVKRELDDIAKTLNNMDKISVSYSPEEMGLVDQFVGKHLEDRVRDTELYLEKSRVTVVGERYDKVDKTAHSLKVHLGHIQTSNRANRQMSMEHIKSTSYETERKSSKYPMESSYSGSTSTKFDDDDKFSVEQKLSNGFLLKIYKASITKLDVDVIVNAANDNLMHGGGVARVISQAAGKKLDEESQDYIARNGFIKVTKNCETTAGWLPYKSVIHAVGPQWHDYHGRDKIKCMDDVYWTVFNVLKRCDERRYRSVGIPAISAGIYGVPKPLCADMYVKAAVDYSEEGRRCPKEMHFIDVDLEILKLVKESVEKWKKNPKSIDQKYTVPEYLKSNHFQSSTWSHRGQGQRHRDSKNYVNSQGQDIELSGRRNKKIDSQYSDENRGVMDKHYASKIEYIQKTKFKWGAAADIFLIDGAIDIKIFKGDIDKVRNLDALVCGIDKSLTSYSFVSKSLDSAGGEKYKQGLKEMKRGIKDHQKKINNVFKSDGGNLGAKHVLHLVNERVKTASVEEMALFREGIFQVLNQAKKWSLRTLAIPLLGTGDIQKDEFKLKKCCSALLHAICDFCSKENDPSIEEIHLINNSGDVCNMMVEVFKQGCEESENFGRNSTRSCSSSPEKSKERRASPKRGRDTGNFADNSRNSSANKRFSNTKGDRRTYTADGKQDDNDSEEDNVLPEGRNQSLEEIEVDKDSTQKPDKQGNLIILEDD